MYESFYGFHTKPFSLLPDPSFMYVEEVHRKTLAKLISGVNNHIGVTLVTGEAGCGKTTLIHYLKDQLEERMNIGLLTYASCTDENLLQWILQAFNVQADELSEVMQHRAFIEFIRGESANNRDSLLIIDEAQNLTAKQLEYLGALANLNGGEQMFQVILVGQPKLRDTLCQPDLRYLTQVVGVEYRLSSLEPDQTEQYIHHRISVAGGDVGLFDSRACEAIHHYCNGVPRLINNLCDTLLFLAHDAQRSQIDGPFVNKTVLESSFGEQSKYELLRPLALSGSLTVEQPKFYAPVPASQSPYAQLSVAMVDGASIGNYRLNGSGLMIGRTQDNDIYLPDDRVSRHHARIISSPQGHYLEDLASANGTYVNAQRVVGYTLQEGDVISIDKFRLCYFIDQIADKAVDTETLISNRVKVNAYASSTGESEYHPAHLGITSVDDEVAAINIEPQPFVQERAGRTRPSSMDLHDSKHDLDSVLKALSQSLD